MPWTPPVASDFKSYFNRDFPYAPAGDASLNFIQDADITKALLEAGDNFNSGCIGDGGSQTTRIFMYLVAFFLVQNIQNSTKGLAATARFPIAGTSVGGVSVSSEIPERYKKDPFLSQFTTNAYGMRYLQLAEPYARGNVRLVQGTTTFQ